MTPYCKGKSQQIDFNPQHPYIAVFIYIGRKEATESVIFYCSQLKNLFDAGYL
jgi:hypothetical protein